MRWFMRIFLSVQAPSVRGAFFALLRPHDDVDHHHNGDDIGDEIREVRAQVFLQAQADGVKISRTSARQDRPSVGWPRRK